MYVEGGSILYSNERLVKQFNFIVEIDKLKSILRQTTLIDDSRRENDAEHSWHLAIMAMLLSEYANDDVDVAKVIKMVLIHDLVEIDAGDTFAYDAIGYQDKEEREEKAAHRILGLLPKEQYHEMYQLWREFEERETPEAKFANALDRIQPLVHNFYTKGGTWVKHQINLEKVNRRFECVKEGSEILGEFVEHIIQESVKKGYILE